MSILTGLLVILGAMVLTLLIGWLFDVVRSRKHTELTQKEIDNAERLEIPGPISYTDEIVMLNTVLYTKEQPQ